MATVVVVYNGRKATIKTTPAMALKTVLAQTCEKLGLRDDDQLGLKHGRTLLDLSLSVRFANIASGAKLDVVSVERLSASTQISIALQLEEGARLLGKFSSDTLLWHILEHFESDSLNITKRAAIANQPSKYQWKGPAFSSKEPIYLIPALLIMDKEVSTLADLKSKTLDDVGITSGSVMIRVMFKFSGKTMTEMASELNTPLPMRSPIVNSPTVIQDQQPLTSPPMNLDVVSSSSPTSTFVQTTPVKTTSIQTKSNKTSQPSTLNQLTSVIQDTLMSDLDKFMVPPQESTIVYSSPIRSTADRQIKLFNPPSSTSTPLSNRIDLPDSFFQLTPAELKTMVQVQRQQLIAQENKPLKTSALRLKEEEERRQQYPKTVIRVRFQDRYQLQFTFMSHDKLSTVYNSIKESMHPNYATRSFYLYVTPPMKRLMEMEISLWDLKLTPASVVYFAFDFTPLSSQPKQQQGEEDLQHTPTLAILHPDVLLLAEEIVVANVPVVNETTSENVKSTWTSNTTTTTSDQMESSAMDDTEDNERERRRLELLRESSIGREQEQEKKVLPKWFKLSKK